MVGKRGGQSEGDNVEEGAREREGCVKVRMREVGKQQSLRMVVEGECELE